MSGSELEPAPGERVVEVLVVEDSLADAALMIRELKRAGLRLTWTCVETRKKFLDGLSADLDLILCDYALAEFGAPTALALLAKSGLAIPLIVVTGTTGVDAAVECMKQGASDYLLKDSLARLGSAALEALEKQAPADERRRVGPGSKVRGEQFRELVEQLPAVVYMWEAGPDGECYYVSPAIESVLGYPVEDWLAKPRLWASRLHPEDHDRVVARELHSRTSGEDLRVEYRMFARDGTVVWIRDEAVMIRRREDGAPDHLQGLMYDVSLEKQAQTSLRRSREETIRRLSRASEFRDDETGAHIERVSHFCELIASRLRLDPDRCENLRIASPMHDIGKIGIPDAILLKPGPLDAEERAEIERHAEIGYRILTGSGAELLDLAAMIAWTHHERFDGAGYPRGLAGEQIPLEGTDRRCRRRLRRADEPSHLSFGVLLRRGGRDDASRARITFRPPCVGRLPLGRARYQGDHELCCRSAVRSGATNNPRGGGFESLLRHSGKPSKRGDSLLTGACLNRVAGGTVWTAVAPGGERPSCGSAVDSRREPRRRAPEGRW